LSGVRIIDAAEWDGVATLQVLRNGRAVFRPAGVLPTAEGLLLAIPPDLALGVFVADHTARAWSLNLLRELESREPGWQRIVDGLLLQGLGHLERVHAAGPRPAWLDDVVALARRCCSLGDIAAAIGRHPSHIAREFRKHEGVTVGEYARRCRLELAARSLTTDDEPISAVALAAGFCDQSHFTNLFRRLFGVTPAQFRRVTRARR
jgi:AraC family transcriptional regulator